MLCESYCLNGNTFVILPERLDSTNSSQVENELVQIHILHPHLILDCNKMTYISSAGLRVVLKMKKLQPNLEIINVSNDVYSIFDMTGFAQMIKISKACRLISIDGCKIIGQGSKGTVYRYNEDTVVKVYNNLNSYEEIKRERESAKEAFVLGIPTAISFDIVKVGDKFGTMYELIDAQSLAELMQSYPLEFDKFTSIFADMLMLVHTIDPKGSVLPHMQNRIEQFWLEYLKPYINISEYEKAKKLVLEIPDVNHLIHCDYHPNNILFQKNEALLIDMDTLCYGHPIYDLSNIYFAFVAQIERTPQNAVDFLKIDLDLIKKFWPSFIKHYLKTEDENFINEVTTKVRFLGLVRAIRHISRRGQDDVSQSHINYYVSEFRKLLNTITKLDWEKK